MSAITKELSIVLFPFMAQGHIIPFLSLARKLEQEKGYSIVFVNTPLNIKKLQNHLPHNSTIRLIDIPFDSTKHGLPLNTENTENLPIQLMVRLIEASSSLEPAFRELISSLIAEESRGKSLVCIISDMFFAWSADVAHDFGIRHAIFNAGGGYGMAGWHSTWLNLPHLKSNSSDDFWLPGFPKNCRFKTKNLPPHLQAENKSWQFALDMYEDWKKTDSMLFNTVEEIDHTGLTYFREQFPKCTVYAIGPIISPVGRGREEAEETKSRCMKFLDSKPDNSVLYIAFGSQNSPSKSQTIELAKALVTSNVNFLWVFRPPIVDEKTKKDSFLEDFEHRIFWCKNGLLLKKWAPQMEILEHKSIGGFLSHCGWNSVIEGLINGVPMLTWPMGAEQPFNAHFLEEEWRVCVGVAYGNECEVKSDEIVKKIELLMKYGEGHVMRRKAGKVMELLKNANKGDKGSSITALDDFLNMITKEEAYISFISGFT